MKAMTKSLRATLEHLSSRFKSANLILDAFEERGVGSGAYTYYEGDEETGDGWTFEQGFYQDPLTDIGLSSIYFRVSEEASVGYCVRVGNNHFADVYMTPELEVIDVIPDAWDSSRCWAGMSYNERQQWCKSY